MRIKRRYNLYFYNNGYFKLKVLIVVGFDEYLLSARTLSVLFSGSIRKVQRNSANTITTDENRTFAVSFGFIIFSSR